MGAALVLLLVGLGAMAAGVLIGRYYVPDDRQLRRTARHSRAYMRALTHLIARDHDTAVGELREIVEENIDDVEPYFALGALFRSRGEHERAIRVHQALALRERERKKMRQRAMYELGLDFRAAGMPRRATRAMEEVLLEEPSHEGALRALAALYEEQARFNESAGLWQRLGKRRNEDLSHREHHLYVAAAQAALARDDLDSAVTLLKQAKNIRESAHFFAAAAELAAARRNHRGARERLKQALIAEPALVPHLLPGLIAAEQGLLAAGGSSVEVDDLAEAPPAKPAALEAGDAQHALPAASLAHEAMAAHQANAADPPVGEGVAGYGATDGDAAPAAAQVGSGSAGMISGVVGGETASVDDAWGGNTPPPAKRDSQPALPKRDSQPTMPRAGSASDAMSAAASGGAIPAASASGSFPAVTALAPPFPNTAHSIQTHAATAMAAIAGSGPTVAPNTHALVPSTLPSATINQRVLALLHEVEVVTGPRLEIGLIRAQLVNKRDAAQVSAELAQRFPDALAARVATARLALAGGDPTTIRAALDMLAGDTGTLAWALRGRWQCSQCNARPAAFSWRCGNCRKWGSLHMETGVEPPPPQSRDRRAAPRAIETSLLGARPDESLPAATIDPGLTEEELARAGSARRSLLGRVGGWASRLWRRGA